MVRQNFTQVRLSDDGKTLRVEGAPGAQEQSGDDAELLVLQVAVAKPTDKPGGLGADLAPLHTQTFASLSAPITSSWTIDVPNEQGFEREDMIVLAGGALCWRDAEGGVGGLELQTWAGVTTVLGPTDTKAEGGGTIALPDA